MYCPHKVNVFLGFVGFISTDDISTILFTHALHEENSGSPRPNLKIEPVFDFLTDRFMRQVLPFIQLLQTLIDGCPVFRI